MSEKSLGTPTAPNAKRRVCVIGWPVEHSRSPLIHNHWIAEHGIENAVYEKLAVPPEEAKETLQGLDARGFIGANVTVPHKETAFTAIPRHDKMASRVRAVNTLVKTDEGWEGRNTDGYGFTANLKEGAPSWQKNKPAVVVGAGGASRAIIAALWEEGVNDIRLINRTRLKSEKLAGDLGVPLLVIDWENRNQALPGAGLLVNTTSLGMKGSEPLDIDLSGLSKEAVVTDIVYTPLITPLLEAARARGNPIVDGLGMLLHQAVPGFEAWFGVRPEVTPALRKLILDDLGQKAD